MKPDKAHEYFSAYYEGNLPEGLKQQFESLLETSPSVAAEYEGFVATVETMAWFGEQPVTPPADLHDLIMRRIDHVAYVEKQKKPSWFGGNLRMAWLGGLGVVAIIAAGFAILRPGGAADVATAGTAVVAEQAPLFTFGIVNGTPTVRVKSYTADTITVLQPETQAVVHTVKLAPNQSIEFPVNQMGESGGSAVIRSEGSARSVAVVLPNGKAPAASAGKGTVLDFAKECASRENLPVFVDVTEMGKMLTWTFASERRADVNFEGYLLRLEVKSTYIRVRD